MAAAAFLQPGFAASGNLQEVLRQCSCTLAMSAGLVCIMLGGGFDFSIGCQMSLASLVAGYCQTFSNSTAVGVLAALAVGIVCGAFNGAVVVVLKIPSYIATLASQFIFRGIVESVMLHGKENDPGVSANVLNPLAGMAVAIALTLLVSVILTRTYLGRYIRAMGEDEEALQRIGVRVPQVKMACYIMGGFLFAVAAITAQCHQSIEHVTSNYGIEISAMLVFYLSGISLRRARLAGLEILPRLLAGSFVLVVLRNLLNLWGLEEVTAYALNGIMLLGALAVYEYGRRKHPSC